MLFAPLAALSEAEDGARRKTKRGPRRDPMREVRSKKRSEEGRRVAKRGAV